MLKLMTPIALIAPAAITVTAYVVSFSSSTDRADCPDKIVCLLTGDLVCKDRCPVHDTDTAEAVEPPSCCPGTG